MAIAPAPPTSRRELDPHSDFLAATARVKGRYGPRLLPVSRAVIERHSRATRCNGPIRSEGVGHDGKCRHSSLNGLPGWANEMACLQRMQRGAIQASLSGGLDGDHAFGDCSSRRLRRATPRNPCRVRGNPVCRSGPDTTGYYMDAQPERSLHPSFPRMRPARSYLLKAGYGVEPRNNARECCEQRPS